MAHLTFQIQNGQADRHLTGALHHREVPASLLAAVTEPAARSPQAILEARGISKLYGGLRAVDDLSFSVEGGEVLGIAGPNGAGKTTLFDTITGHTIATTGEIELGGSSILGTKIHARCRMGLARTFQQPVAADTLTVLENAYLAASFRRGRTGRRSRTDDVAAGEAALEAGRARAPCDDGGVAAAGVRQEAADDRDCARHRAAGAAAGRAVRRPQPARDRRHPGVAAARPRDRAWRSSASST